MYILATDNTSNAFSFKFFADHELAENAYDKTIFDGFIVDKFLLKISEGVTWGFDISSGGNLFYGAEQLKYDGIDIEATSYVQGETPSLKQWVHSIKDEKLRTIVKEGIIKRPKQSLNIKSLNATDIKMALLQTMWTQGTTEEYWLKIFNDLNQITPTLKQILSKEKTLSVYEI